MPSGPICCTSLMPTPRPASSRRTASRSSTTSRIPERQALADHHRACRARRGHLHHAHVLAGPGVVVEVEADLASVEVLRGVDIAYRDGNDLKLHVHEPLR